MAESKSNLALLRKLHQEGKLNEAKQGYLYFLKKNANNVEAMHALAIISAQQENFEDAQKYLQTAIQLQPKNPVLYLHLANVLKIQGLFSQSIDVLEKTIQLDPNCISAYNNLGTVYYSQNKLPESIQAFRKALEIQPDYIDAHYNLGLALIKHDDLDAAIELYEHLLKHAPGHFAARFQLACALMRQDKITQAEKHFLTIDATHPTHFETQTNLATCYLKQGALSEAKKRYLSALELSPQDTQVLFNLGVINTQLDNLDNAIQYYQRALQVDPDFFEAHNNLGGLFLIKQHAGLALHHFQQALRLQPANPSIRYTVEALSKNQLLLAAPPDYITTLFDAYADHYDVHLLTALEYQVPKLLHQAVNDVVKPPVAQWDILDLGCGTGLSGIPFKSAAKTLVGVDLSTKMLEVAAQKKCYDSLIASDLIPFLADKQNQYDLVLAGDVLVYMGDLDILFSHLSEALRENGLFSFNAEICKDAAFQMNQSGRFSHQKEYIDQLAEKHQFKLVYYKTLITRTQNNEPVYGHVYVMKRHVD